MSMVFCLAWITCVSLVQLQKQAHLLDKQQKGGGRVQRPPAKVLRQQVLHPNPSRSVGLYLGLNYLGTSRYLFVRHRDVRLWQHMVYSWYDPGCHWLGLELASDKAAINTSLLSLGVWWWLTRSVEFSDKLWLFMLCVISMKWLSRDVQGWWVQPLTSEYEKYYTCSMTYLWCEWNHEDRDHR